MEQDWWLCEVSILALSFQLLVDVTIEELSGVVESVVFPLPKA